MDRRTSWLRVIACFMVVLLHVCADNFYVYDTRWASANLYDSMMRACVPLFFMISGANLLAKRESLSSFLRKRCMRILPPFLFWSLFYLCWRSANGETIANWAQEIIARPASFHLWYFYALIGLYAVVPVLRKFYQHGSSNEQLAFLALWLLVASIYPMIVGLQDDLACGHWQASGVPAMYQLLYFGGFIGYFVLGAMLAENRGPISNGLGSGLLLFMLGSAGTAIATWWLAVRSGGRPCEFFYSYLSPLVITAAYGLFSACMSLPAGLPSRRLAVVSDCTLGIYCLHIFVMQNFKLTGVTAAAGNAWITSLTTAAAVFAVSLAVIWLMRSIKLFRHVT
ncbi:acyltransferase [Janthinobacterium agaricidamnosum]|uniref:Acyltransferase family protein n=1 Tax=Janthinobacterium agaricidamnosum NBRC 102515 = DSM 9628 TaxID=1349767 RepID=W0V7F3_9BURK|nr:acyltransferase family protein [Janthinobacterium agaricidamnosum]CDG83283.1 acyltransferase family protein [Janthinobacterium agaricidamnosum NBRC 102515 = DSM 9628]